jgi:hypothetical protein
MEGKTPMIYKSRKSISKLIYTRATYLVTPTARRRRSPITTPEPYTCPNCGAEAMRAGSLTICLQCDKGYPIAEILFPEKAQLTAHTNGDIIKLSKQGDPPPMPMYKEIIRIEAPIFLPEEDLITLNAAALLLEISVQSVSGAASRGSFRVFIDPNATNPQNRRRLLLRSEVEEAVAKK